jgi:hypothetical protein
MAYTNLAEFEADYKKSAGRGKAGPGMDAKYAYIIYQKSLKPPLMCCVLGRHIDKKGGGGGIEWFGGGELKANANSPTGVSGADDHVAENFGVVAETEGADDKFIGSILAAGGWDLVVNDTWVLAGVHGLLPFYCASLMNAANLLDDTYGVTITGREVLGLLTFGYKFLCHDKLGHLFEVKDKALASAATFEKYDAVTSNLQRKGAEGVFKKHGILP